MSFKFTLQLNIDSLTTLQYKYKVIDSSEKQIETSVTNLLELEFHLKDGQSILFEDLPAGILYSVIEETVAGYEVAYDEYKSSRIKKDDLIETVVQNSQEAVTASLKSIIYFYGTKYASKNYDYPGYQTPFTVTLRAEEEDAPMPSGAKGNELVKTSYFSSFSTHGNTYARKGPFSFGDIVYTKDSLSGKNKRVFKYWIIHGKDNQTNKLNYIDYNFDTDETKLGNENKKAIQVTVTVTYSAQNELGIQVEYQSDPYKFPEEDNTVKAACFADRYLSTSVSIAKKVSGRGAKSTDRFKIYLTLLDENNNPLKNWKFYTIARTTRGGKQSSSVRTTNSNGQVTFETYHGGVITFYGIPNDIKYEISEEKQNDYYAYYDVTRINSEKKEIKVGRKGRIDGDELANGKISCGITNIFSLIPLTGYGNPINKTLSLIVLLLIASVCAYARRKLQ